MGVGEQGQEITNKRNLAIGDFDLRKDLRGIEHASRQ